MTQIEFDTLKTIIVNSEEVEKAICNCANKDYEGAEYPNFRDRLRDGESIIDLYIELGQYLSFQGLTREDHEDSDKEFWSDVEEVLVEPEEKRFVFALCTPGGSFEDMIVLKQSEIISENIDEDDEGIYHLKFQINREEDSSYFLSKEEL